LSPLSELHPPILDAARNTQKRNSTTQSEPFPFAFLIFHWPNVAGVAPLLQEMLRLKFLVINEVADVAPFPTSYTF
jgi:hypothetical protein